MSPYRGGPRPAGECRIESDCLGELPVPARALYGIQTERAIRNFPITGVRISHYPEFVKSLAFIKKAAALANRRMELLDEARAEAICAACDQIIEGRHRGHFRVDVIQGGAGTSSNMNANEVIANLALEIMGRKRGDYAHLHPNNHVNLSQSTNDVYPSAIRLTLLSMGLALHEAMGVLAESLAKKSREFADVIKIGRTQLQDAVPMTLGQEFGAWAIMVGEDRQRLLEALDLVREINLGGTAIGTGINAPKGYAEAVVGILAEISGRRVVLAENLVEATQDAGAYVQFSGVLKRTAVKLSKICNDLRLLSSGPRCGLGEIHLPEMAPGSSIMPGKVNPIIPEVVNQIAFQVIGSDLTVTMAAEAGQLELNAMEPVLAHNLFGSLLLLRRGCKVLAAKCIDGITADEKRCRDFVAQSMGLATALSPYVGYETAARVALDAIRNGRTVHESARELLDWDEEKLSEVLAPEHMLAPTQPKREYFGFPLVQAAPTAAAAIIEPTAEPAAEPFGPEPMGNDAAGDACETGAQPARNEKEPS
ncbi:Fumarate hydratase class II [Desulfovibrio sp. X2]|uniref:aspartate ammonia-lyase n=1 Tax=Desulfovibrio sp. X2 TaxID=941449 RepID=UPI000358B676|nr:aspartate ammonia-lyase [Desulfovibrio sp. X2]EPR43480.1 Fumarate hydratase class II [Desulfovibrio sp. X2]